MNTLTDIRINNNYIREMTDEQREEFKKTFADNVIDFIMNGNEKTFEMKNPGGNVIMKMQRKNSDYSFNIADSTGKFVAEVSEVNTTEKLIEAYERQEQEKRSAEENADAKIDQFYIIRNSQRWNEGRKNTKEEMDNIKKIVMRDTSYLENFGTLEDLFGLQNKLQNKIHGGTYSKKRVLEILNKNGVAASVLENPDAKKVSISPDAVCFLKAYGEVKKNPKFTKVMSEMKKIIYEQMEKNTIEEMIDYSVQSVSVKDKYAPTKEEMSMQAAQVAKRMMKIAEIIKDAPLREQLDLINAGIIRIPKELRDLRGELSDTGTFLDAYRNKKVEAENEKPDLSQKKAQERAEELKKKAAERAEKETQRPKENVEIKKDEVRKTIIHDSGLGRSDY